jgi:hypothetical protein
MPLRSSKEERDGLTPTSTKEAKSTNLNGMTTKDAVATVTKADAKNIAFHNDDSRTSDGSGVGGKGHLHPLVPSSSSPSTNTPESNHSSHDVNSSPEDHPSDTTLASPADEGEGDDDAEDNKKDSDEIENPPTPKAPTSFQKVANSPRLEKTTSLTRDFANEKIDEDQEKKGVNGKKKNKKGEEEANKMENGIKPKGGFSPRAMMKGTRFGRRAGGEVQVV